MHSSSWSLRIPVVPSWNRTISSIAFKLPNAGSSLDHQGCLTTARIILCYNCNNTVASDAGRNDSHTVALGSAFPCNQAQLSLSQPSQRQAARSRYASSKSLSFNHSTPNSSAGLNGWLQLLPHDALYAVPDHLPGSIGTGSSAFCSLGDL